MLMDEMKNNENMNENTGSDNNTENNSVDNTINGNNTVNEINNGVNENDNDFRVGNEIAVSQGSSTILLVVGWIAAVLSLFAYPFIFGVVGIIMGILAVKSERRAGLPLIVTSIIFMAIGLIYSGVIMNYMRRYLGM